MTKAVFLVVAGLMPETMILGIYEDEKDAEKAIETNDLHDSLHCYIEQCELNEWYWPPLTL